MLPTKVEIKLKKAEAISWGRLVYQKSAFLQSTEQSNKLDENGKQQSEKINNLVESVDLEDL